MSAPVVTLEILASTVAYAAARCHSAADRVLVDAAETELTYARIGRHGVTDATRAAVLALESICAQPAAELRMDVVGSRGDVYRLTREHGAAPWRSCSCPARVACKHLRSANEEAVRPAGDPLARYRDKFLPETIRRFEARLLRIERLNDAEDCDHRAFARELQTLVGELEGFDRCMRSAQAVGR